MAGNFSNNGVDTFDPSNQYLGLRLQQGVPLLDRDWNELYDIRLHLDRELRRHYLGAGVPDLDGFAIRPIGSGAQDDVLISAGHCSVDGYDVVNPSVLSYSEQGDRAALPAAGGILYLEPVVTVVDAIDNPDLGNTQDINIETCLRDQLGWVVRFTTDVVPPNTVRLAQIRGDRPGGRVRDEDIVDLRRNNLNLAHTLGETERNALAIQALRTQVNQALDNIELMQQDLDRIFWQVSVTPSKRSALFGARVGITIQVTDRRGTAIQGAHIGLSSDWGSVSLASSVTDQNGEVEAELVGVNSEVQIRPSDIAQLDQLSTRVVGAMVQPIGINSSTSDEDLAPIAFANLQFAPHELELVSRYTPSATIADITNDLPRLPEVALPSVRTATVNVFVKESPFDSIIKANGNVQVRFGEWVRPWIRTKMWEMLDGISIASRVGDLIRQGVTIGGGQLDPVAVVGELMPGTFGEITDDTTRLLKDKVFGDEGLTDGELRGSGKIGQALAAELTSAVGAKTQQAISVQIQTLADTEALPADQALVAEQTISNGSSMIVAGLAQRQKQLFTRVEV